MEMEMEMAATTSAKGSIPMDPMAMGVTREASMETGIITPTVRMETTTGIIIASMEIGTTPPRLIPVATTMGIMIGKIVLVVVRKDNKGSAGFHLVY